MNEYFVYILKCSDDSYYTGMTNNLEQRIVDHDQGIDISCYTYKRRPFTLVYSHGFREVDDAIKAEKRIQGWSRRKKEALIHGDIALLQGLAMSKEKQEKYLNRDASSSLPQ